MRGERLLICGGRRFRDVPKLWNYLDGFKEALPEPWIRVVIDGASDDVTGPYWGADYWGHEWAKARGIPTIRQHAEWDKHGRARSRLKAKNPEHPIKGIRGSRTRALQDWRGCSLGTLY